MLFFNNDDHKKVAVLHNYPNFNSRKSLRKQYISFHLDPTLNSNFEMFADICTSGSHGDDYLLWDQDRRYLRSYCWKSIPQETIQLGNYLVKDFNQWILWAKENSKNLSLKYETAERRGNYGSYISLTNGYTHFFCGTSEANIYLVNSTLLPL
jgi:hypothetical protein